MKDIRYSVRAGKFRKYFITSAVGLSFVTSIYGVGGIFMTSYLLFLGATAGQIGFLAAIPELTNVIQIFSIMVYRKYKSRKKVLIVLRILQYIFMYGIMVVPRIITGELQFLVIAACFFFGHVFRAVAGSGAIDWNNMFVPPEIKGRHFSKRNLIGNASYIVISLTLGAILDSYGGEYSTYIAITAVTLVFVLLELIMYARTDDYCSDFEEAKPLSLKNILKKPFSHGPYKAFMIFSLGWMFARSLAMPYYTYYSKTILGLDYTYIAILGSVVAIVKIFAAGVWGGTGDKNGWRNVLSFSGYIFAGANMLWAFTSPATQFLYPVVIVTTGIFMIGANITVFNLNFELSPEEDKIMYFGLRAAVVGIFSFIAPNISGFVFRIFEDVVFQLAGMSISGYQIIFFISALGQFVAIRQFVVYLKRNGLGERHT
ncbi:MAG TPA: MFS transporter [Clostridia bacterium]|nr:MFS transporter [Clostridia bacterium]